MLQSIFSRYRKAYSGLSREVWWMAFALFVNRCGTMVLPFLTLFLTRERGLTEADAGLMISAFGGGAILGAYFGGRLIQSIGAVRVQIAALFLSAPCFLLIPVGQTWPPIAAALFLLGAVSEAVHPANAAAIVQFTTPETQLRGFALQRLAANLGFSFGPAVGGWLADINFRWIFIADAVTTFLAAALLLNYFGFRRVVEPVAESDEAAVAKVASPRKDGVFLMYLGLMLVGSLVFFQFWTTYPLYLREHYGLTKTVIGRLFAVNTVVIVLFEMILIDVIKKWPLLRTIGWGSFVFCLGFALHPYGSTLGFALLLMLIITIGEMFSHPLCAAFVAERSPKGSEGLYMGWYAMTFSIAAVIGPAAGANLYDVKPEWVWLACLVIGLLVLTGFYTLAKVNAQASEQNALLRKDEGAGTATKSPELVPATALEK